MTLALKRDLGLDVLKGAAILAVVGLHFHSALPSAIYTTSSFRVINIGLNQLFRFSVPLFVAVSGYLLGSKYLNTTFNYGLFFKRRALRLIPQYLFWSFWIYLTLKIIPEWANSASPLTFKNLLFGGMDYHLYFVPMLFCLYLIFPLLNGLKRYLNWLVIVTFILQLSWYYFISVNLNLLHPLLNLSDQAQYLLPITWIFYFVLGYYFSQTHSKNRWVWPAGLITLVLLGMAWTNAFNQQSIGWDIIIATRFTRVSILAYATGLICFAFTYIQNHEPHRSWLIRSLAFSGKYSYLIYLSHTLWLRLLLPIKVPLSFASIITAASLLVTGNMISWYLNRKLA